MSADPYSSRVRQLFASPMHAGVVQGGPSSFVDDQGVRIALSAELDDDTIRVLRFQAWACPHLIAVAEAFCEAFEGAATKSLLEFSSSGLMQSLSVPAEKTGRILVFEDAVRSLGHVINETD